MSWKAGVVCKPRTHGTLHAAYGNLPTPAGGGFALSATPTNQNNPDLDPQESRNVGIGTKWDFFKGEVSTGFSLYRSEEALSSFSDAVRILSAVNDRAAAWARRNLAGTHLNGANPEHDLSRFEQAFDEARRALALVPAFDRQLLVAADLSLKARRAICDAPGRIVGVTADADTQDARCVELSDVVDEALSLVRFWDARAAKIFSPAPFAPAIRENGAWPRPATTTLTINPFTGDVLSREGFSDYSAGRRLRTWTRFLHTGEAVGWVGRLLAGLASLGGVVLVYTGIALAGRRYLGRRKVSDSSSRASITGSGGS